MKFWIFSLGLKLSPSPPHWQLQVGLFPAPQGLFSPSRILPGPEKPPPVILSKTFEIFSFGVKVDPSGHWQLQVGSTPPSQGLLASLIFSWEKLSPLGQVQSVSSRPPGQGLLGEGVIDESLMQTQLGLTPWPQGLYSLPTIFLRTR